MEHSSVLDIADSISPSPSSSSPSSSSSSSSKDDGTIPWNDQIGLLLFFVTTIISILVLVVYSTRAKKFCLLRRRQGGGGGGEEEEGGNRQGGRGRRHQNSQQQQQQQLTDRVLAEELQRRLNEEERERDRLAKRKERRMWYEYYMKPCSMVIERSDLFYALDEEFVESKESQLDQQHRGEQEEENDDDTDDTDDNENNIVEPIIVVCQQMMEKISKNNTGDEFVDSDDEEIGESGKKQKSSQFVLCDEHNENATLYVNLPAAVGKIRSCAGARADVSVSVSDSGGENIISRRRCVDGTCALCIDEYEEGDMVVWSDLQCPHAFHKECLMQWLSKGKKRCPICRHWFVPGAKIDDQKIAHGEAWQRSLKEMEQREDEGKKNRNRLAALLSQKEKSSSNNEKLDETTVDIKLGDAESGSTILHQYSLDSEYMGISGSVDMSELDIENQQIVRPSNSEKFLAVQNSIRDGCNQEMASKDAESNFEKSEVFICDEFNQV